MGTFVPSGKDIRRKWFVVDASGKTLGRLAGRPCKIHSKRTDATKLAMRTSSHKTAPVLAWTRPSGNAKKRAKGGLRIMRGRSPSSPAECSRLRMAARSYGFSP